jgi:hypothetical protein
MTILADALKRATAHCQPDHRLSGHDNLAAALSVSSHRLHELLATTDDLPERVARVASRYLVPYLYSVRPAREPGDNGAPGKHNCRYRKPAVELRRADRARHGKRRNWNLAKGVAG